MNAPTSPPRRRGAATALLAALALPYGWSTPPAATLSLSNEDPPVELAQRRGRRDLASDLDADGNYKPDPIYSDKAFGLGSGLTRSKQVRNQRRHRDERRQAKPADDNRKRLRGEDQKDEERAERAAVRGEAAE